MISIGDLVAKPGEKVSGSVQIIPPAPSSSGQAHNIDNENDEDTSSKNGTSIPITIINSANNNGPALLVLSGIHGSEYIPIQVSQRLANIIDPFDLQSGAVIFVHIANLPAYLGRTIYTSPDGKNLNRVFPGKPNGTITERIAHFLVHNVYHLADYVIDMHSGDANEQLGPSYTGYYGKAGSKRVVRQSRDMAVTFGLDIMVEFQWELEKDDNDTSKAIWAGSAAVVRDIPSIDVELAPGMGVSQSSNSFEKACQGVFRIMNHHGMIGVDAINDLSKILDIYEDSSAIVKKEPCHVKERVFIESPMQGSWVSLVDTGALVQKGTTLGYVTDLYGNETIFEAIAPDDGLLLIRFNSPPVVKGDTLDVVAVINASDPNCNRLEQSLLHGKQDRATQINHVLFQWQLAALFGWMMALAQALGTKLWRRKRSRGLHEHHTKASEVSTLTSNIPEKNEAIDNFELVACNATIT